MCTEFCVSYVMLYYVISFTMSILLLTYNIFNFSKSSDAVDNELQKLRGRGKR